MKIMSKVQKFLSRLLSVKQKNTSGGFNITKAIDALKGEQKRMNRDLFNQASEILDEAEKRFGIGVFSLVKIAVEKKILIGPTVLVDMIAKKAKRGWFVRECVYTMIANTSGDMIEHLSKSSNCDDLKDPISDLLKIFDAAVDELVLAGDVSSKIAEDQKAIIRTKIQFLA